MEGKTGSTQFETQGTQGTQRTQFGSQYGSQYGPSESSSTYSSSRTMPSNTQMIEGMEKLRQVLREQRRSNTELDERGRQIASAVESFLDTSQSFIQERNWDEAMQRFAEHVMTFTERVQREAKDKADTQQIQNKLVSLAKNLRYVVQHLFTSTETRSVYREMENFIDAIFEASDHLKNSNSKYTAMPENVKNDLVDKNLKLLSKIGSTPASKEMRQDILSLFDYWRGSKAGISQGLQDDFSQLFEEALCIMERFTERDLHAFWNNFKSLCKDVDNDHEAHQFFKQMRENADYIVNNPEKAQDQESINKSRQNFDRGLSVMDRYGDRFRELFKEFKAVLHSLQDEKYALYYKQDIKSVGQSLRGNFLETAVQLRALLIPILKKSLEEIKLPRIEDSNQAASWTIDNIVLNGKETNLDDISLKFKIGLKDLIKVTLKVKNIDARFRGVEFTYNRTATPSWSDKGVLDCRFSSPCWKLKWIVDQDKGREPRFELAEASSRVKRLDINFVKAEHKWVDTILMPLWTPALRASARKGIENMLRARAEPLTDALNKYFTTEVFTKPFIQSMASGASAALSQGAPSQPQKASTTSSNV